MSDTNIAQNVQKPFNKRDDLSRLKRIKSDIDSTLLPSSIAYRHFIIHQVSNKTNYKKNQRKQNE